MRGVRIAGETVNRPSGLNKEANMYMSKDDETIRGSEHIETLSYTLIAAVLAILAMTWFFVDKM